MNLNRDMERYVDLADSSTVAKILNIIIRVDGGITRTELARLTGFSKSTITHHVTRLMNAGFVCEKEDEGARRSLGLVLNNDKGYLLGIDLGITSLHVGLCSLRGEPLAVRYNEGINVNLGPQAVMALVTDLCSGLLEQYGVSHAQVLGIGMGVPAPVEFSTGKPIVPPIMRGWDGYPVREHLQQFFSCPVFVDNDVNILAMAENWAGCTKTDRDFLYIKLGSGIGCGIFTNGRIYRGADGCAGDIGHIAVEDSDAVCACGNTGCLEALAGGTAIGQAARRFAESGESEYLAWWANEGRGIDAKAMLEAINAGDIFCLQYIRQLGEHIGGVLAKMVNIFNPTTVVFGGGVAHFDELLLDPIRRTVLQRSSALATRRLGIRRTALGEDGGVTGAAILARDELFQPKHFGRLLEMSFAQIEGPAAG